MNAFKMQIVAGLAFVLIIAIIIGNISTPAMAASSLNREATVSVAAGANHVLLLAPDGSLWAWGNNDKGECGIDKSDNQMCVLKPVRVPLSNIKSIAAGSSFSMALKNDGTVWAWGDNHMGQLGIGAIDTDAHPTPIQVPELTNIVSISVSGYTVMALRGDGTVWVWGEGTYGQLGDGEPYNGYSINADGSTSIIPKYKSSPVRVLNIDDVKVIFTNGVNDFAVKNDNTLWGWGLNSSIFGENSKNLNGANCVLTPVSIHRLNNLKMVSHTPLVIFVSTNEGTIYGWGVDTNGLLGYSQGMGCVDVFTPVQLNGLRNIESIMAGTTHAVALENDGTVWTWGANHYGQIGNGKSGNYEVQVDPYVVPIRDIKVIAAGSLFTIAISEDGTIWGWGSNDHGELGDGSNGGVSSEDGVVQNKFYRSQPVMAAFNLTTLESNTLSREESALIGANPNSTTSIQPSVTMWPYKEKEPYSDNSSDMVPDNMINISLLFGLLCVVAVAGGIILYLNHKK